MKIAVLALALTAATFSALADVRGNLRDLDNAMDELKQEFLNAPKDGDLQFDPVPPEQPGANVMIPRPGSADERQRIENSIRTLETQSRRNE